MAFLFAKIVASRCWALIQLASLGSLGQPVPTAASRMAPQKYRTKTQPRRSNRNSRTPRRSTRNPHWSRLKTSSRSAAAQEQMLCKEWWRAQLFSKFCVTSFDKQSGAGGRRYTAHALLTFASRGTARQVDKNLAVPPRPSPMSCHQTAVPAVQRLPRFRLPSQIVQSPHSLLPMYAAQRGYCLPT